MEKNLAIDITRDLKITINEVLATENGHFQMLEGLELDYEIPYSPEIKDSDL